VHRGWRTASTVRPPRHIVTDKGVEQMARPDANRPGRQSDEGASAVEYGLILVAIAAAIALIVFTLGVSVSGLFSDTCDAISAETTGTPCA